MVCLAKSPNKQNRVWMVAKPLNEKLGKWIEEGQIGPGSDLDIK